MRRRLVRSPAHPLYSGEKAARGRAIGPVPGSENPPPKERDFGNEQAYFQAQDLWLRLWTTVVLPTVSAQPSARRGNFVDAARQSRAEKWKRWASKHPLYDGKGEAPRSKSPVARTPPAAAWTPVIDLDIGSDARDGSSVGGDRRRRQPLLERPHLAAESSGSGSGSSQPDAISPLISSSARDAAWCLMHGELNQAFRVADAIDFDDALGLVEIGLDVTFADAQLASGRVGMTQAPTQSGLFRP